MNKPFYIFLFIMLFCCEAKAQTEYITNGSFEQIDSCFGNYANIGFDVFEWSGCNGWSNPIASSSDLWCQNPIMGLFVPPYLNPGFQYPRTGENFAGFFISYVAYYNYREYVQNKLISNLLAGKGYEISFYLSSNTYACNISEIGIKFYNQKLVDLSKLELTSIIPDAVNNATNFIKDTLGWQKITLNYRAVGNESHMVIGCFTDSVHLKYDVSNCDTTGWIGQIFPGDYIYIDDVSIIEAPYTEPIIPNVFTPNQDGINDVLKFNICCKIYRISIYNRWGNIVFETNKQNHSWNGRTTSGETCTDGNYFYVIDTEEKIYKGFVQLVR